MLKDLVLPAGDWNQTPQSVKTAVLALEKQLRLFQLRFTAYEQKIAA